MGGLWTWTCTRHFSVNRRENCLRTGRFFMSETHTHTPNLLLVGTVHKTKVFYPKPDQAKARLALARQPREPQHQASKKLTWKQLFN